jgi:hypothetical protein
MGITWQDGYSAELEIILIVQGSHYRVAKLGPTYMILVDTPEIPAGAIGKLVVRVDDRSSGQDVLLYQGAVAHRQEPVPFY